MSSVPLLPFSWVYSEQPFRPTTPGKGSLLGALSDWLVAKSSGQFPSCPQPTAQWQGSSWPLSSLKHFLHTTSVLRDWEAVEGVGAEKWPRLLISLREKAKVPICSRDLYITSDACLELWSHLSPLSLPLSTPGHTGFSLFPEYIRHSPASRPCLCCASMAHSLSSLRCLFKGHCVSHLPACSLAPSLLLSISCKGADIPPTPPWVVFPRLLYQELTAGFSLWEYFLNV